MNLAVSKLISHVLFENVLGAAEHNFTLENCSEMLKVSFKVCFSFFCLGRNGSVQFTKVAHIDARLVQNFLKRLGVGGYILARLEFTDKCGDLFLQQELRKPLNVVLIALDFFLGHVKLNVFFEHISVVLDGWGFF